MNRQRELRPATVINISKGTLIHISLKCEREPCLDRDKDICFVIVNTCVYIATCHCKQYLISPYLQLCLFSFHIIQILT